ncbi:MAG: 23S rRNA (uracil(1939)-C(5))-methyltransferase RlmD, partial [Evtepia sp.]
MQNKKITLKMIGYASDGAGVSHLEDGRVMFVKGGLAGETCEVLPVKLGKNATWGTVTKVLESSPERIPSDCPYYPTCGGCQLRHMTYQEELFAKHQRVQDTLTRIGSLRIEVPAVIPALDQNRYRNKIQFPVAPGSAAPRIGFYRAGTHDVVNTADCLLQPEAGSRLRQAVQDWMCAENIPAYDERKHEGMIRHVFLRVNHKGESLCAIVANAKKLPKADELIARLRAVEPGLLGVMLSVNCEQTNVILGKELHCLWGQDFLEDKICGLDVKLSALSFYQVNRTQAEVLYQNTIELAELKKTDVVLDLYCGIGTITMILAQKAGQAIGAEIIPAAVRDARENAKKNGIENIEFLCADAGDAAETLTERGIKPDVICVDPPRKGLARPVIDAILKLSPDRILYVSCDPATLARDLKLLVGYEVKTVRAVDMFPRTM